MEVLSRRPGETEALGAGLGGLLAGGELIALTGPLGAGKTVFVRGLARGLGCSPGEIASPTYVLERVCRGRLVLRHLDAYRLSGAAEFEAADLGAALAEPGSVAVLEWADRVVEALPEERLEVVFEVLGGEERRLRFTGRGARYLDLVERLSALRAGGGAAGA